MVASCTRAKARIMESKGNRRSTSRPPNSNPFFKSRLPDGALFGLSGQDLSHAHPSAVRNLIALDQRSELSALLDLAITNPDRLRIYAYVIVLCHGFVCKRGPNILL